VNLLPDLLEELLSGSGPSSERGLVATSAVVSAGAGLLALLLDDRDLSFAASIVAIVCGGAGSGLAPIHMYRNEGDRLFGWSCLAAGVAGLILALVAAG
jgi:hypothetical protein